MKQYEQARVAIDAVIFTVQSEKLFVLVFPREKEPFLNQPELLGGLLLPGETAEETLKRKLKQILPKQRAHFFKQFHTFSEPNRDPRTRTVSIGFFCLTPFTEDISSGKWVEVSQIKKMAFDHHEVIQKALKNIRSAVDIQTTAHFLPPHFPLNHLQKTLEAILDKKFDNRNFRKMVLASGLVIPTGEKTRDVSYRPAVLYRFK